jgi:hypothetical protein
VPTGPVTLTITDVVTGQAFRQLTPTRTAGINRVQWNLRGESTTSPTGQQQQGPLARAGTYRVTLTVGGRSFTQTVQVVEDQWMREW